MGNCCSIRGARTIAAANHGAALGCCMWMTAAKVCEGRLYISSGITLSPCIASHCWLSELHLYGTGNGPILLWLRLCFDRFDCGETGLLRPLFDAEQHLACHQELDWFEDEACQFARWFGRLRRLALAAETRDQARMVAVDCFE